jgi:hypothetical protein
VQNIERHQQTPTKALDGSCRPRARLNGPKCMLQNNRRNIVENECFPRPQCCDHALATTPPTQTAGGGPEVVSRGYTVVGLELYSIVRRPSHRLTLSTLPAKSISMFQLPSTPPGPTPIPPPEFSYGATVAQLVTSITPREPDHAVILCYLIYQEDTYKN